jgi:cytochrome c peroxidase
VKLPRLVAIAAAALAACKGEKPEPTPEPPADAAVAPATDAATVPADAFVLPPAPPLPPRPEGLPRPPRREREPAAERVELGRLLFHDEDIWGGDLGCAACHVPARGFSSAEPLTVTRAGRTNLRHAPSLYNLAYQRAFYWDGRAASIAALIPGHVRGQLGADVEEVAARLGLHGAWRAQFERSFGGVPSGQRIALALADFARTRYSPRSAWDRHESGEPGAGTPAAVRGARIFNDRAGCAVCHPPPLFTDLGFHPTAVPDREGPPDPGRARITGAPGDRRSFKTPSLRGLAATAPYFHAGTAATLADAIAVELDRANAGLTAEERADLLAFLEALSP